MAHVKDDGGFDAPVEKIWRCLQDESPTAHHHASIHGMKTLEAKGNAMTREVEFLNPDG